MPLPDTYLRLNRVIASITALILIVPTPALPASRLQSAEQKSLSGGIDVSGSGFTLQKLESGLPAFGNRAYTWRKVPPFLAGWQFTQVKGGEAATITVHAGRDGDLYVASEAPPAGEGWQAVDSLALTYSDKNRTTLTVYKKHLSAGVTISLPQSGWAGTLVLLPPSGSDLAPAPQGSLSPPGVVPGVVIDYFPPSSHQFIGSPSIAILPDGSYAASHDIFFGAGKDGNHTRIFRSTDRGQHWQLTSEIDNQYWSNLFVSRGTLYILGTNGSPEHGGKKPGVDHVVIRRSENGGRTWTTPVDPSSGILSQDGDIRCGPTPVAEANGRLWKAFETNTTGSKKRVFQALVLSAPAGSDLLRAENWTPTNDLAYRREDTGANWLEGNAIATANGDVAALFRLEADGIEKAALLHVTSDGKTLFWNPPADRIDFPGGGVKFTVRYDPISKRYWSLVNKQRNPDALRNVLCLTSSPDLRHWQVETTLLSHPDKKKHAFQYIDWQFDGEDIIFVSRTSWNGDSFHNANYLTFHRLRHFRDAIRSLE